MCDSKLTYFRNTKRFLGWWNMFVLCFRACVHNTKPTQIADLDIQNETHVCRHVLCACSTYYNSICDTCIAFGVVNWHPNHFSFYHVNIMICVAHKLSLFVNTLQLYNAATPLCTHFCFDEWRRRRAAVSQSDVLLNARAYFTCGTRASNCATVRSVPTIWTGYAYLSRLPHTTTTSYFII